MALPCGSRTPCFNDIKILTRIVLFSKRSLTEDARENDIDVGQMVLDAQQIVDLSSRQIATNLGVRKQLAFEIAAFLSHFHRMPLDHSIGDIPRQTLVDQSEKHLFRKNRAAHLC